MKSKKQTNEKKCADCKHYFDCLELLKKHEGVKCKARSFEFFSSSKKIKNVDGKQND